MSFPVLSIAAELLRGACADKEVDPGHVHQMEAVYLVPDAFARANPWVVHLSIARTVSSVQPGPS